MDKIGFVHKYLKGSIPLIDQNIDPIEKAIKYGKGARLDINPGEYAVAKKCDLGYYVRYFNNGNRDKSPFTHRFDILKEKLMAPLGDYREWRSIE